jgi:hypothetical protein
MNKRENNNKKNRSFLPNKLVFPGIVQKQIVNIVIFSVFYIKSSSQTQGKEIVFHIIYLFKKKKKNNLHSLVSSV